MGIHVQRDTQGGGADAEMAVFAPIGDIADPVIACARSNGPAADQGAGAQPPDFVDARHLQLGQELMESAVDLFLAELFTRLCFPLIVFIMHPDLRLQQSARLPLRPEDLGNNIPVCPDQMQEGVRMQNQIRIDQEQVIIAKGFGPADHQVFESCDLPDQVRIPEMGCIGADIGIMKAGGLQEDLIPAGCEGLEQAAGLLLVVVINQIEIQFQTAAVQTQQRIQKRLQNLRLLVNRAADQHPLLALAHYSPLQYKEVYWLHVFNIFTEVLD
ncbi:hypothetical protein D3C75_671400 [compost metagenome]